MSARFEFVAKLWRYSGETAAWHFITLPRDTSTSVRSISKGLQSAFGSLRVIATVGKTTWRTSIFPEAKTKLFVLPVKADIRRRERIGHGDRVKVAIEVDL